MHNTDIYLPRGRDRVNQLPAMMKFQGRLLFPFLFIIYFFFSFCAQEKEHIDFCPSEHSTFSPSWKQLEKKTFPLKYDMDNRATRGIANLQQMSTYTGSTSSHFLDVSWCRLGIDLTCSLANGMYNRWRGQAINRRETLWRMFSCSPHPPVRQRWWWVGDDLRILGGPHRPDSHTYLNCC